MPLSEQITSPPGSMNWIARLRENYDPRAALLVIAAATFFAAWTLVSRIELPKGEDFNVLQWELQHVPGKWVYLTERLWSGDLSSEQQDQRIARMLELTSEINDIRREPERQGSLESLERERDSIENDVEAVIEGRVTSVLEDIGLESSLPLLRGPSWVWPPVDFELDQPLPVLSVSPRDRIERIEGRPLKLGLTRDEAEAVERRIESDGDSSAIVDAIGGVATYPGLVAYQNNYQALVETVAHEWMHQYLFFKPLGRRYYGSAELRTLNETVANMVGEEIARMVVERYPLASNTPKEDPAGAARRAYTEAVLRQLRIDVERLLDEGRISEAETLMEERRVQLANAGIVYRRINQAFFAARSFYADTGASIDPIGPKLQTLRAQSDSLKDFVDAAADLTSVSDLDRALAERAKA